MIIIQYSYEAIYYYMINKRYVLKHKRVSSVAVQDSHTHENTESKRDAK